MNNFKFYTLLVSICLFSYQLTAQTTVADGNWSDPMIWAGYVPPITSGDVVIKHNVTLDTDYAHFSGTVTIEATGSLVGNSPMRAFALNLPAGTATMENNGVFKVNRVNIFTGTFTNKGQMEGDSLFINGNFTNTATGKIDAEQFLTYENSVAVNNGKITSINIANAGNFDNNAQIIADNYNNTGKMNNLSTGTMAINSDFSNKLTIVTGQPIEMKNDGIVHVLNNWSNEEFLNGSGSFCIGNLSFNSGTMTGTFDFCGPGGGVDTNIGTIDSGITTCQSDCSTLGLETIEFAENQIKVYPNPFQESTTISTNFELNGAQLMVHNIHGQEVLSVNNLSGNEYQLSFDKIEKGIYFLSVVNQNTRFVQTLVVE